MLKLGSQNISALYLGGREIKRAYLGKHLVFGPAPVQTYTITATIDPSGSGTVTGAGQYQEGATVTLVATAGDGYKFSGWQEGGQAVSASNPYTFIATGDRAFTAEFEVKVPSRLPDGYTEVEYIQSDTSSYIQTNYSLGNFTSARIVMDIEAGDFATSQERIISSDKDSSSDFLLLFRYTAARIMYRYASQTGVFADVNMSNKRLTVDWDFVSKTLSIGSQVFSFSGNTRTTNLKVRFLGATSARAKIYSAKIYKSGALIADYVPCVNPSGFVGMYDIVGDLFYANAGTGTFTAGPAV